MAPRADPAFGLLVGVASLTGLVLVIPLVLTLTPSLVQRALQSVDSALALCSGAFVRPHDEVPPVGVVVLALAAAGAVTGLDRLRRSILHTAKVGRARVEVEPPVRLRGLARRLGVDGALVCCVDARPYAYCAGALVPRIYISTGALELLSEPELGAVLLHERHHMDRRDPLRVVVGRTAASLLFAVPLVGALERRFEVAKELDADRATVRALGGRAGALAGALLALGSARPPFGTEEAVAGAWSLTGARIDQLAGADGPRMPGPSRTVVGASLATVLLALALGTGQAARAHLLPPGILPEPSPGAHQCPVRHEGPLF